MAVQGEQAAGDVKERFEALDEKLKATWKEILERSKLVHTIERGEIDRRLYGLYLLETYQYTLHNSRNQALVGVRSLSENGPYLKFCFEHASEEAGHEQMAMHDLLSLGLKRDSFLVPAPLPATEVLIGYLYWISGTGNPLRRLGYSYWAESSYQYITPLITRVQQTLSLKPAQMTFFVSHSRIDEEHALQVHKMISSNCQSEADWRDVEQVMVTSLRLTGGMMEGVYTEYERLVKGEYSPYTFLNTLT
jgi:thiaminase